MKYLWTKPGLRILCIMSEKRNKDCEAARPYRLKTRIQNYPWGTQNSEAFIPRLLGFEPEADKSYAEMWMGVHPNGPSSILDLERGAVDLSEWLSEQPSERLSLDSCKAAYGLPYLLKVLSAAEALSIQAHPSKQQAEALHKADPEHYPDDNHKPEIAIALDHLDALVGFISKEELTRLLQDIPEINDLIDSKTFVEVDVEGAVEAIFTVLGDDPDAVGRTTEQLYTRLSQKPDLDETENLFMEQYRKRGSDDVGLIFLFMLKRVHLSEGEAIFLPPGVPHAYLKGNIIECMANSDNVVRLGLTNKFCDAAALKEIIVCAGGTDHRITPIKRGNFTDYLIPAPDFKISSLELSNGALEHFTSRSSMTMFLLTEGEVCIRWTGESTSCTCVIKRGDSFITPANLSEFKIIAREDAKLFLVELP